MIVRDGETAVPKVVILDTASFGDMQVDGETPVRNVATQKAKKTKAL